MRRPRSFVAALLVTLTTWLTQATPARADFIQQDLYFGRNIAGGGEVSEAQFQGFVDSVITPRFPAGLTAYDAKGQFLDSSGALIREPSKVLTLFFEESGATDSAVKEIVREYRQQFSQESVLQVANKDDLKVSFGSGDLFSNSPTPKQIQVDLYFGRNIPGGGEVSEAQFQEFVDSVITPRFPAGLTAYDAKGQFLDSSGALIEEASKVVTLILEDTSAEETSVNEVIDEYIQRFNQESVLVGVNEDVGVSFGPGGDLFDNDSVPTLIQADLYFGRNIPGGGEVSEAQFQEFVDSVITPLFPAGLTTYDAAGQFLDSSGALIEEASKVLTLILEDTLNNETFLDQIIGDYIQEFGQESVLTVIDEEIGVAFVEAVPEPSSLSLLLSSPLILLLFRDRLRKKR